MKHYNTSCPMVKVVHKNEKSNKPLFTKGLRNACIEKNKIYSKFLKNCTSENSNKYKAYKNKLSCIIRSCERMYYNKSIENTKSSVKQTWNVLRNIIKKNHGNGNYIVDTFTYDNNVISDPYKYCQKV